MKFFDSHFEYFYTFCKSTVFSVLKNRQFMKKSVILFLAFALNNNTNLVLK